MKNLHTIFCLILLLIAQNWAGTAPKTGKSTDNSLPEGVVLDPKTGEKVYANQLMLAFKEGVSEQVKETIFKEYSLTPLTSSPSLNIYQVSFENPRARYSKLRKTRQQLQQNPKILYVYPCKLEFYTDSASGLLANKDVQRKGEITLNNSTLNGNQYRPKTVNETISQHQGGLSSCIEKKRRLKENYHGSVSFVLSVTPAGEVDQVRITKTSDKDKQLLSCFLKKIKNWRDFPENGNKSGNWTVEFSFNF